MSRSVSVGMLLMDMTEAEVREAIVTMMRNGEVREMFVLDRHFCELTTGKPDGVATLMYKHVLSL